MHTDSINYQSSSLSYSWFGTGSRLLLCLHGYGESKDSFQFLENHLPTHYSALAIDFPFHGHTKWNEGLSFTIEDLLSVIDAICSKQNAGSARITIIAFSMGGRIALQLLQRIPEQIEKVILLAPDGLKVNFWYWLSTQTYIGNRLFSYTMHHPQWFFTLLQISNRLGLINQSVFKFIRFYLHDTTARQLLYERWTCLRSIRPHLESIKKIIQTRQIPVRLLYGKYDRIIRHERAEKFQHGIESFCTLQVIEAGHQLLQEKNASLIIQLLQS